MDKQVREKIDALFGVPTSSWAPNTFNILPKEGDCHFGVLLDWEEEPPAGGVIEMGRAVQTHLFSSQPVWWDHGDGQHIVLGWIVRSLVVPTRWNDRFVACKRAGFPDDLLVKGLFQPAKATINRDGARLAMTKVLKNLPSPEVTAALHGILILETGDVSGIAVIGKNADLKI